MNKQKLRKIEEKIDKRIEKSISSLRVFDEPRPRYIAKVTLSDKIIDKIFLWAFSEKIRPNFLTVFRFITIPFIIFLLLIENYKIALPLFIISAFSDALDGAIARTRKQITDWGIVFDPLADKLLIGSVGGILIFIFISHILAMVMIFLELVLIISAYYRFKGEIVPAKLSGKIKMILQSVGVALILLFLVTGYPIVLIIASYILYLAVFFALLSIFVYRSI